MQHKKTYDVISQAWREDIRRAVDVMNKGGIILYPTDTIWGLGCDATNEQAVRKIYEIKRRADSKAMIALVDSDVRVQSFVRDVPDVAWDLIELSEKPLTIIYDGARGLAPNLLAEDGSIAMRITRELFSKELCARMRRPVVSTSANLSGLPAPSCFAEIADEIKQSVDYVCSSRQEEKSSNAKASSIIRLGAGGLISIIRE